jgi:hypothetical protein
MDPEETSIFVGLIVAFVTFHAFSECEALKLPGTLYRSQVTITFLASFEELILLIF